MANPQFKIGLVFISAEVLKRAVKSHVIPDRRPVVRHPNMGSKIQFMCTPPCNWKIYASKCQMTQSYQIKTYRRKHTCQATFHQKHITADSIAREYIDDIRMNPKWEGEAFQKKVAAMSISQCATEQKT